MTIDLSMQAFLEFYNKIPERYTHFTKWDFFDTVNMSKESKEYAFELLVSGSFFIAYHEAISCGTLRYMINPYLQRLLTFMANPETVIQD